jgi:hypothetical protein
MSVDRDHFTLTSPSGHFIFEKGTKLAHAKLIRDLVTASERGHSTCDTFPNHAKPHRITTWVRDNLGSGPVVNELTAFVWVPAG